VIRRRSVSFDFDVGHLNPVSFWAHDCKRAKRGNNKKEEEKQRKSDAYSDNWHPIQRNIYIF
jgi:hypothetical protein